MPQPIDIRAAKPALFEMASKLSALGRLGTPQDYAKLVRHILDNDMLNGEVIRLDGAIRLAPR